MRKLKLYVMTHKMIEDKRIPNDRTLMLVGSYNKENLEGYIRDDSFDNISIKNSSFCELTGLYWMWKNDKSQYVGLEHYRRLFSDGHLNWPKYKIISLTKVEEILQKYDIIVASKHQWPKYKNLYEQYKNEHIESDLQKLETIIFNDYPDYIDSWNQYIYNNNSSYNYNMFVTSKKIIDEYCEFLFSVLFKLEPLIDLQDGRDNYQRRVFGFLSERLFNVWLNTKKDLKIKELKLASLGDSTNKDLIRRIYRKLKWRK